ncbi:MAG: DNA repair protein RecN [Sphaerochaetaceae bacterium]|jgi:DNA repair protein RecN (Recombination protein N)|nr:DNA repair protein RecN [Sphaerochaetaceae bacterium]
MLERLSIRNLVLIETLDIDFSSGFSVITGETGAGKSILMGALDLLIGEKSDAGMVRTGTDEALVSATFSFDKTHPVVEILSSRGIVPEDGSIIINRTLKMNGRGSITVQSIPVTRSDLSIIGAALLDMHGQHEHQSLFSPDRQRKVLDSYGSLETDVKECADLYRALSDAKRELQDCNEEFHKAKREEDFLRFAHDEITRASIKKHEDEQLQETLSVLSNHETIFEQLEAAREHLGANDTYSIVHSLSNALSACRKALKLDPSLDVVCQRLESVWIEVKDIDETLRDTLESMTFSAAQLDEIQGRLAALQRLKKKYGPSLDHVIDYGEQAGQALMKVEQSTARISELEALVTSIEQKVLNQSAILTKKRNAIASKLGEKIVERLKNLGMPHVVFSIAVEPKELSQSGADHIEFRFSANIGVPLGNLRQIASGGELSRVMLAIKTVLAESDDVETMVFDEVDAGIGGSIAIAVGEQLRELSKTRQVIAITHLASIAAKAHNQFVVTKKTLGGSTYTAVEEVFGEHRIVELARMLSGDAHEDIALEHAKQLLKEHHVTQS